MIKLVTEMLINYIKNNVDKPTEEIYKDLWADGYFQKDDKTNKQLFGYMGGKGKLSKQLIEYIPEHKVYVEPFFGSGALFFKKGYKKVSNSNHYREIIGDLDSNVYNFFKVLKEHPRELFEVVNNIPYSEELKKEIHTISDKYKKMNDIEKAAYLFFNILSGFSKVIDAGFAYSKSSDNNVISFMNKILLLKSYSERLKDTYIFNKSYDILIDRFDSEDTFFYLDPPYRDTTKYVVQKNNDFKYESFVNKLKSIKGKWMFSHYKDEWLLDNFSDYIIIDLKHSRSICKSNGEARKKADCNECIVMNYDITKERIENTTQEEIKLKTQRLW